MTSTSLKKALHSIGLIIFLILFSVQSFAQAGSVSGTVTDAEGKPIVGATVKIKGANKATVTKEGGTFSFSNVPGSGTLIISHIAYTTMETPFSSDKAIIISLKESTKMVDEVVVTGVFDKRTALQSSIAISTLKSDAISKLAPNSAADLLSYTPGVYVNSSVGEINNTVFSRGVNANQFSVAGGNGYYYVSLMEDGLPVSNLSSGNIVADYFYRADATLSRLESVRGGSASITGANAPGGIFNYVSKTGQNASNELTYKFGLEGDGRNAYNRLDGNFGGKLGTKGWFYNVGGFYRISQGARSPGYAQNKGGQFKANLVKTFSNGSVKIFAKYLNDKNGLPQNLPARNYDKPQLVEGFGEADTYMLPDISVKSPLWGTDKTYTFDPSNLSHSKDYSLGSELNLRLGNGWSLTNNFKVDHKNVEQSLTIMANPTPLNGFFTYALMGMVGPGTFSFKDRNTKTELASVSAAFDPTVQGPPFRYTILKNNLPANSVMQDGVLFNFTNYSNSKLNEVMDQLTFNKKAGKHSISFGSFIASSHVETDPNGTANTVIRPIENKPQPLDITWTQLNGKTYQVTSPEGYAQLSGGRFSFNKYEVTQTQLSGFLADGIQLSPNLNLDLGVRFDHIIVDGSNNIGVENPKSEEGGIDKDPLTLYDNFYFVKGEDIPYKTNLNTVSYSAGINYQINQSNSIYGRYSSGRKSPDMQFYFDNYNTPGVSPEARAQKVNQIEIGYKFKSKKITGSIIPFYSELSDIPVSSIGQDTTGLSYFTPVVFNAIRTFGVEGEANVFLTKHFDVRVGLTVQSAKATTWQSWVMGANGKQDDKLTDNNGNTAENIPNLMYTVVPTYSFKSGYVFAGWKYMGKRAANMSNAFDLPGFHEFNLGAGYNLTKRIGVAANINNLFNTFGVMNWSATTEDNIIDGFSHNSFTPEKRKANPNSVYSVLPIQPRAYFVSVTYKF
ncbi:TonB-dependent receptor [Chitinophagaceae bacterium LB-8]|uniref:TonB-dependent receptor n=1 Tax=Paraflavisolibacter caeni TaxID=2982496 RepID=A0A9X2XW56_9BACT|nr:TonB-dependent receptor [Paraflavisolibacter caeni]MCU7549747.1 TonB-dependent receptor [Paraflavisolibacter caeni]